MSSSRPYMIRAIYQWILDNQCTPYLLVNAEGEGVVVPQDFVQDGQIVLNISETAVVGLTIDNAYLSFSGRFGGVSQDIWVPVGAVLAIYARENGQGMLFEPDDGDVPPPTSDGDGSESGDAPKRPSLKVVK
ncbi:stringent starvation protein B [Litorivivens lipolytica]|uniref:Stringent starvation protein B n=1 Tax=Litorivivens lipolytica TaxID=1524264 RepID=A0A7W4W448_9GAMM|nr:ClpXP protease specificity-enhancing factor [Litorivivens lipolytica]MBB3047092.1 stringent starvation protein B [Litorivivens lipolytica]